MLISLKKLINYCWHKTKYAIIKAKPEDKLKIRQVFEKRWVDNWIVKLTDNNMIKINKTLFDQSQI